MKKIKISEKQWNTLRIMYAFALATRHYHLNPDVVFIEGLNPAWIKARDVFGLKKPNLYLDGIEKMKVGEIIQRGCFKIRRTKKGAIVYTELVRLRESKK